MTSQRLVVVAGVLSLLAGCPDVGGNPPGDVAADDPLNVDVAAPPGSLDDLYDRVIAGSCAGQPGLCHNGQFEPNLSTPALAFVGLVDAPALERTGAVRVVPGNASASFLVDKLRNRGVLSQMPLGAHPLSETDVSAIEAWIDRGARRFDDVANAPAPNRAPEEPGVAVFDADGHPLDGAVVPGTTVVLRMSTRDFETADEAIPMARFLVFDTRGIAVLSPGAAEGEDVFLPATYVPGNAPEDAGESLDRVATFVVPATIDLVSWTGERLLGVSTAGADFSLQAQYADADGGAIGFTTYRNLNHAFAVVGEPDR